MAVRRMSSGGRSTVDRAEDRIGRQRAVRAVVGVVGVGLALGGMARAGAVGEDPVLVNAHVEGYPSIELTVDLPPGSPVIAASQLGLTEDGRDVDATVRRVVSEPLDLVLVVDTSGASSAEVLAAVRAAATRVVDRLPEAVRVGLVASGPDVRVLAEPTGGRAALGAAIAGLAGGGPGPLYDAVATAGRLLDAGGRDGLVVLIAAGGDDGSAATLDGAVAAVAGRRVEIVSLETPATSPLALARLAIAGRGDVATVTDATSLGRAIERLGDSLLLRYSVVYRSTGHGPVEVRVATPVGEVRSILELPTADASPADPATTTVVPTTVATAGTVAPAAPATTRAPTPAATATPAATVRASSPPAAPEMGRDGRDRSGPGALTGVEAAALAALVIAVLVRHVGARTVAGGDALSPDGTHAPVASPAWPAPVLDELVDGDPPARERETTSVG